MGQGLASSLDYPKLNPQRLASAASLSPALRHETKP
jgi:hypothetical protein